MLPDSAVDDLASDRSARIADGANFFGGAADTITGGLTAELRGRAGIDGVDYQSDAYRYGGQVANVGPMALGRSRGGFGTKIHASVTGRAAGRRCHPEEDRPPGVQFPAPA